MFIPNSLWSTVLFFIVSISYTIAVSSHRENLAKRHPCYSINKRLEPYIKWTEKLISGQYGVQKDACGQTRPRPTCCTNEVINSYAGTLGSDLKHIFDTKFGEVERSHTSTNEQIDNWMREYLTESRRITISSLQTVFGSKEHYSEVRHSLLRLFHTLGSQQSTDDEVTKATNHLLDQLIVSTYRRFMTQNPDEQLDDRSRTCLTTFARNNVALPKELEFLYTLSSAASLIRTLRTLFLYIGADIERLKTSTTLASHPCLQRYTRETLCPICVHAPSSMSSLNNYDNHFNEPLCEPACHYVMETCFNQTNNPYVAFTLIAQGYSKVIKQIQEFAAELKLVERLSQLHIYLYDMVVHATNTPEIYTQLQKTCPSAHKKPFTPLLSLPPITSERRELVSRWNTSLHLMFHELQFSIESLNTSLTQQITTDICSNPKYAAKSSRCTQIDQHTLEDFVQWPLPSSTLDSPPTLSFDAESIHNQLEDLKKRLRFVEDMVIALRPKKKVPIIASIPNLDYDSGTSDTENQLPYYVETYENENPKSLSDEIYGAIDGHNTQRSTTTTTEYPDEDDTSHSSSLSYHIRLYFFVFLILIIRRISFTHSS